MIGIAKRYFLIEKFLQSPEVLFNVTPNTRDEEQFPLNGRMNFSNNNAMFLPQVESPPKIKQNFSFNILKVPREVTDYSLVPNQFNPVVFNLRLYFVQVDSSQLFKFYGFARPDETTGLKYIGTSCRDVFDNSRGPLKVSYNYDVSFQRFNISSIVGDWAFGGVNPYGPKHPQDRSQTVQ